VLDVKNAFGLRLSLGKETLFTIQKKKRKNQREQQQQLVHNDDDNGDNDDQSCLFRNSIRIKLNTIFTTEHFTEMNVWPDVNRNRRIIIDAITRMNFIFLDF
jgi:hypothetical protein